MRAWQIIQTLSVVQVMGPVKDQEAGTATIDTSTIRSFQDYPNVTGRMIGWKSRTEKKMNQESSQVKNILYMKPSRDSVRWRQP